MATLCEGYTLCGFVPAQNRLCSGIQGIEEERDTDHVIVTDSTRSVTLYKVSDQKPLGSWTVKQGQVLTCSAVFNTKTKEYVVVSDNKVIRIWKEEDIILDKAFKATVSADVRVVHCPQRGEPVVLFQGGAVRLLDSLLSAPQQPIEELLAQDETIRWSTSMVAEARQLVMFTTELKGDYFLYLQRLNPNSLQRYRLEREEPGLCPLSFSASYREKHICLLYLYPNGHVYQSLISARGPGTDEGAEALPLPRTLILSLPVGDDLLEVASAIDLDEAHVAVVGVPHPCAGPGKDFLCIWNTNFQILQAGKEMAGKLYGQMFRTGQGSLSSQLLGADGGLYDFGRALRLLSTVRGLTTPPRNYKAALVLFKQVIYSAWENPLRYTICMSQVFPRFCSGKTKAGQDRRPPALVPSWNNTLHGEKHQAPKTVETRKSRPTRRTQSTPTLTTNQILELIKSAPAEEVQKEVEGLLSRQDLQDLQPSLGQLTMTLVSRSLADPAFYTSSTLAQLVHTQCLCHSLCPNLVPLALEKKDYFLCQLCLQFFPDIPEAITCACLKAFISLPDADADKLSLEPDGVSFMETLISKERGQVCLQNGFSPTSCEENCSDAVSSQQTRGKDKEKARNPPEPICPVGVHKAALINEVLQTAYSDTFLLPHLKDLSSQHVVLFLQYLQFLYLRYSQDASQQKHGFRSPSLNQIMDWVCMLLDAHFTVLVMTPEAKGLLLNLSSFVHSQVKLFLELGKIESSLQELNKMKVKEDVGQYSIEVLELF